MLAIAPESQVPLLAKSLQDSPVIMLTLRRMAAATAAETMSIGSGEDAPTTEGTPDQGEDGSGDGDSGSDWGREGDETGTGTGARTGAGVRAVRRAMVAAVTTRGRGVRKKEDPTAAPAATTGYSLVAAGGRDLCPSVNASSVPKGER